MSISGNLRRLALTLLVAPALLVAGGGAPLRSGAPAPEPVVVMPVLVDEAGRITADVHINGQGPFRFLIDTGANRSAVSHALVQRLGLPILGVEQVHTFTGPVTAPITRVGLLRVGASVGVRDARVPVLDDSVLAGADGVLGADSLVDRRIVMGIQSRTVRLEDAAERLGGRGWLTAPAQLQRGNLLIADGSIAGVKTQVIIDTGSQASFVNLALVEALERRARRVSRTGTRLISAGRPQRIQNFILVPQVDVGGLEVENVSAYAEDVHIFNIWGVSETPAIVIGMDVWGRVEGLAIDYRRGLVYVRP